MRHLNWILINLTLLNLLNACGSHGSKSREELPASAIILTNSSDAIPEVVSDTAKAEAQLLGDWKQCRARVKGSESFTLHFQSKGELQSELGIYLTDDCEGAPVISTPYEGRYALGRALDSESFEIDLSDSKGETYFFGSVLFKNATIYLSDGCQTQDFANGLCPEINGASPETRSQSFEQQRRFMRMEK